MLRKMLILAGGLAFAWGGPAWADAINATQLATFAGVPLGVGTVNNSIDFAGAGGATYINTFTPGGLQPGAQFKSILGIPLGQLVALSGNSNIGTNAVQVATLIGTVGAPLPGGGFQITFQQGVARVYTSNTPFITNDLSTWGLPGTASAGTLLDTKVLKLQESVTLGNPNAYNSFASGKGPGAVNTASTPVGLNSIAGTALFRDSGTLSGTTFTPNTDIWSARTTNGVSGPIQLPGALTDFTDAFQQSIVGNRFDIAATPALAASNLAIANATFAAFSTENPLLLPDGTFLPGGGPDAAHGFPGLLAGGFGFATNILPIGTAGVPTDYTANLNANGFTTTGDFASQTANNATAPTLEPNQTTSSGTPVPEIDPGSIAGALTLLGGGLMLLKEKRRRKN